MRESQARCSQLHSLQLGIEDYIVEKVSTHLHSVLTVSENSAQDLPLNSTQDLPLTFFHVSFRDFHTTESRSQRF